MAFRFTADEVLQIAEQIERNGAHFYREAAARVGDAEGARLLADLSAWELRHEQTYAALRAALPEEARERISFDPTGELPLYLRALADRRVFDVYSDPLERIGAEADPGQIFAVAVGVEKDSVVFYVGMKEVVPEQYGGERIDGIIKEEMAHLALLGEWRAGRERTV